MALRSAWAEVLLLIRLLLRRSSTRAHGRVIFITKAGWAWATSGVGDVVVPSRNLRRAAVGDRIAFKPVVTEDGRIEARRVRVLG
jgi:hypothetical protein